MQAVVQNTTPFEDRSPDHPCKGIDTAGHFQGFVGYLRYNATSGLSQSTLEKIKEFEQKYKAGHLLELRARQGEDIEGTWRNSFGTAASSQLEKTVKDLQKEFEAIDSKLYKANMILLENKDHIEKSLKEMFGTESTTAAATTNETETVEAEERNRRPLDHFVKPTPVRPTFYGATRIQPGTTFIQNSCVSKRK